jgi:hypothetical protein
LAGAALGLPGNDFRLADRLEDFPPAMVVDWLRCYWSILVRVSTGTLTSPMTARQTQAEQRKALLRLRRSLFRCEEYSASHPAPPCSGSAPPRKATRTASFRPVSVAAIAQLLIDAARRLVAKSPTLMTRVRKLQSHLTATKVSDVERCDDAKIEWIHEYYELAQR